MIFQYNIPTAPQLGTPYIYISPADSGGGGSGTVCIIAGLGAGSAHIIGC